jgi:NDP-sugar pyrophosphorylase family protein
VSVARTSEGDLAALDVFVLAGGLGTRIRPVLGDLPKLLAPLGGRPYLAHLFDWLRQRGAWRVILGLGYQADAVLAYLRDCPPDNLKVETVVEPRPLGTAGALRFARGALSGDPVLVMNGDSLTDADLSQFVAHYQAARVAGALASVVCAEVADAGRYGRVEIDNAGFVRRFVEKDGSFHGRAPVNAGVYLLSAALLDDIAAGDALSLERDVFARLTPKSLAAFAGPAAFIDIGTPESLARAGDFFQGGGLAPGGCRS